MLLIRTNHDNMTNYLYNWCEPLISEAIDRGIDVTVAEGEIDYEGIKKRIEKKNPKLITFNGHGNESCFFNNKGEVFIDTSSAHIFRNTITFARSCNSLAKLGPEAVKCGCISFIGYLKRFWIAWTHGMESRPLQDPTAKPIFMSSNIIVSELLKGKSVKEAIEKSHEYSKKEMRRLIFSGDPLASAILQALFNNDLFLDFEGDSSAVL